MSEQRPLAVVGNTEGLRPYGAGGMLPADVAATPVRGQGDAVRYVSDVPFDQPYNERPECAGTRTNGKPCHAKVEPGLAYCASHNPEG